MYKVVVFFKKNTLKITVSFIVIFLTLLSFQGFDVCDEGWYMTFYQQFFNAPQTVEYNFAFWLTGLIGGLWYEIFPNGGVLSFRILAVIIISFCFMVAYKTLINSINKIYIVLGLLMVLIVNDFGYLAFYYNHLSSLLALITICFLLKGLSKNSFLIIAIAGFFTATNVLSKLPNITLFAFALVFPMQMFWIKDTRHRYWMKQALFFFLGSVIGFMFFCFIMYMLGHIEIIKSSIFGIIDKGKNPDSNHNIFTLFTTYIANYSLVLIKGIKIITLFVSMLIIKTRINKSRFLNLLWYTISFAFFVYLFKNEAVYSLYFLGLIGVIGVFFSKKETIHIRQTAFLAFIMLLCLPIGSDGGISNVGYVSLWLAIPIAIWFYFKTNQIELSWHFQDFKQTLAINKSVLKKTFAVLVIAYFIVKLYNIGNEAYFDKGSRFYKTHSINSDLAKNIYTKKERADIVNELLIEIEKYVDENDYLFAYDNIPMVNFLTKTKPYLFNSWVWIYDSKKFESQLQRAEETIKQFPVVVQQKFKTIGGFSKPEIDYMSETKEEDYIYKRGRVKAMNSFLIRNNYTIIWSNAYFNILKSNKTYIDQ